MKKDDLKISQADFDKTKVSRLSDRPNVGYGYGGRALSAQELKERYDASAVLIREHFNALIDAFAGVDENGERIPGVADLILTGIAASYTLADLFAGLGDGSAMQYIKAGIDNYSVKGYLQYLATRLADKLEGSRIEATAQMLENGKAPTVSVRMDGQGEDKTVRFDFGIPEGKEGKEGPQGIPGEKGEKGDPGIVKLADELGDSESVALSQKATTRELKNIKNDSSNAIKGTATGAAVRMDDVSPVAHEMAVKVSSINIFDSKSIVMGGISGSNGVDWVTDTNVRSEYMTIKPNTTYYFGGSDLKWNRIHEYDKNRTWIRRIVLNTDGSITTSGNAAFLRVSFIKSDNSSFTEDELTTIRQEEMWMSDTATEYTPYIEDISAVKLLVSGEGGETAEYTVNPDGTVTGVISLSTTTTLMTDTEGAIIDVEYNRDINKAFDEFKNAIIALGGNV